MLLKMRCESALDDVQFEALKAIALEANRYPPDYQYEYMRNHLQSPVLVDPGVLAQTKALKGLTFRIEIGEATPDLLGNICSTLQEMERKVGRIEIQLSSWAEPSSQQLNTRVAVHVPGHGLLMMNDVMVLEDCCTDKLRDHLGEGWRILAICPQPDQRRPDYVVGRTKKESVF